MSYDVKCFELAETFIDDEPKLVKTPAMVAELAQIIQDAIEDYINHGAQS